MTKLLTIIGEMSINNIMYWLIILVLLHFICGVYCINALYQSNSVVKDFDIIDILLFILLGPILLIVWGIIYLSLWIITKINKQYERKTQI